MSVTRSDLSLLRMVSGPMWWLLADAIVSDDGIRAAVQVRSGGNFGVGRGWGRYAVETHGIDVYRQQTGTVVTVMWATIRDLRSQTTAGALGRLAAASRLAKSGPRYRIETWPPHLRPESLDPSLTEREVADQRRAIGERWEREVHQPYLAHRQAAADALAAAFDEVLRTDEPMDILEILASWEAA